MAEARVLHCSSFGHVEAMAHAVATWEKGPPAGQADVRRVPQTALPEVLQAPRFKLDQSAPMGGVEELTACAGIVIGSPRDSGECQR